MDATIPNNETAREGTAEAWSNGRTFPIWAEGVELPALERLPSSGARADVCVVGAGIAGLTTAYLLAKAGKSVVVLDQRGVGGGETGRTSAHLSSVLDERFMHAETMHGVDATRTLHRSHARAIDMIEEIAGLEGIGCGFHRVDGYLFPPDADGEDELHKEFQAAVRADVQGIELLERPGVPGVEPRACIRFPQQARFQPMQYLVGLAGVLGRMGVKIYGDTHVRDVQGDGPVIATAASGAEVRAQFGVAASNVPAPVGRWAGLYTKQAAYRTYVVCLEVPPGSVGDALYWDMVDPYHYVRLEEAGGRTWLVVGGEDHKTGQEGDRDAVARFGALEAWARLRFPGAGAAGYRWSGQVNEPDDGIAFIGRVPVGGRKAVYVITGDSGMGLTHGTLGAAIVADLILERANPWAELYDPARKAWRAPGSFLRENLNAAAQLGEYATPGEAASPEDVKPGCGALVRDGLTKLAVHRDRDGRLHVRSAICPHLGCVVQWNDLEKSWDCPCHGSRFDGRGRVVTGPAIDDLRDKGDAQER